MSRYQNMTKMLRRKKWITLRERGYQKYIDSQGKEDFCQKGVDALIIMDMYNIKKNYPDIKKIILVASDSDFVPVIKRMEKKVLKLLFILILTGKENLNSQLQTKYLKLLQDGKN